MNGKLYGVGVGPGDPELITLKAVKVLESADIVAVPDTGGAKTVLEIVRDYIHSKPVIFCPMPMTRDEGTLKAAHRKSADSIMAELKTGKNIAFITLGDPSIYSTYMYIHKLIIDDGYDAELIPGVPSFCAAAAALGLSLCEGGEPLHIIPASYPDTEKLLISDGTKILMKSGKSILDVKNQLKKLNIYDNASMAERCGMIGERLHESLDTVQEDASYFSVIIVKSDKG